MRWSVAVEIVSRRITILPEEGNHVLNHLRRKSKRLTKRTRGAVFVEYLLLVTLVGLGVIVGLATLRSALINELGDLAQAINAING